MREGGTPASGLRCGCMTGACAIGVRARHAIAFHGAAINLLPDLGWSRTIVPCGIRDYGVTSLAECGLDCTPAAREAALRASVPAMDGLQP